MPTTGKISYSDEGSSPECIVCLHGIGGDEKSFEPQINELSKTEFRVLMKYVFLEIFFTYFISEDIYVL